MYGVNDRKLNRGTAWIIAAIMLFAVVSSVFFIAAEAEHECSGDNCPICNCIQQCERLLYHSGDGVPEHTAALWVAFSVFLSFLFFYPCFVRETPVSRKVRLDD